MQQDSGRGRLRIANGAECWYPFQVDCDTQKGGSTKGFSDDSGRGIAFYILGTTSLKIARKPPTSSRYCARLKNQILAEGGGT